MNLKELIIKIQKASNKNYLALQPLKINFLVPLTLFFVLMSLSTSSLNSLSNPLIENQITIDIWPRVSTEKKDIEALSFPEQIRRLHDDMLFILMSINKILIIQGTTLNKNLDSNSFLAGARDIERTLIEAFIEDYINTLSVLHVSNYFLNLIHEKLGQFVDSAFTYSAATVNESANELKKTEKDLYQAATELGEVLEELGANPNVITVFQNIANLMIELGNLYSCNLDTSYFEQGDESPYSRGIKTSMIPIRIYGLLNSTCEY